MISKKMCTATGALLALVAPAPVIAATTAIGPVAQVDAPAAGQMNEKVLELEDNYDDAYNAWRADLMEKSNAFRAARAENPDLKFERPEPVEPDFWPKFNRFAGSGSSRAQV